MNDRQLARKLILVVLIKVMLIVGLWWAFVRDQKVGVDSEAMTGALTTQTSPQTHTTGEPRHGH